MDNKREDVIRKVKKLMAIANDKHASKDEVIQAMALARKQMIKFKIEEHEIGHIGVEKEELVKIHIGTHYGVYGYVFNVVADNFRCGYMISGRINSNKANHFITGLEEDVEIARLIINPLIEYLDKKIKSLVEVCIDDVKKAKSDYVIGFSRGLKEAFERSLLEMDLGKNEIMLLEKPQILKDFMLTRKTKKRSSAIIGTTKYYDKGIDDGKKYKVR